MAQESPLGKDTDYVATYTPSLLFSMQRAEARQPMGLEAGALPFRGVDVWTCYEFSWLNERGKPEVGAVRIQVLCDSETIVESKSLKLYLNSFAHTEFPGRADVLRTLTADLSLAFRAPVLVDLVSIAQLPRADGRLPGTCLDSLDLSARQYERQPELLAVESRTVHTRETVHSHAFRSICPVTAQPDWGSVMIQYAGHPIDHASLLKYLISYRNEPGFHEATIEQIFVDIRRRCGPDQLTVYGCFLRRGGIDINPYRSTLDEQPPELRLPRQ